MSVSILTLSPAELTTARLQGYLQHAIAPRPVCFASTINRAGQINLSPFSFFNLFSTNPPVCIFSPARRVRDNTTKHSLENVYEVPEVVINIVSYSMVQQTSLASTEFTRGVNEFEKAGFTMEPSGRIRPPRVKEAPVQLECKVTEIKPLGTGPGAGNLIFAEVLLIHIHKSVLDDNDMIDQAKIDLVARLGANWYCRVTKENLFEVEKPLQSIGIGVDALPFSARQSTVLTGNDLGRLGNMATLPNRDALKHLENTEAIRQMKADNATFIQQLHKEVKTLLDAGKTEQALLYVFLAK